MKRDLQTVLAGIGMLALAAMPAMSATQVSPRVVASPVAEDEEVVKGTSDNPYLVTEITEFNYKEPIEGIWLDAYIVGWVNGMFYSSGARFEIDPAGETSTTNIIVAASPDVTDPAVCLPVELPAGDVREALNLYANEGNLGKHVKLYGNYTAYFGRAGFKKVTEYEWVSAETPDVPDVPEEPEKAMYVIGDNVNGSEWSLSAPDAKMTETSDGVWEWDGELLKGTFKFNDGDWNGEYNIGSDNKVTLGEPCAVVNGSLSGNLSFAGDITEIAKPHIVLDLNSMNVTVTGTTKDVTVEYYLVGDFNQWVIGLSSSRFELQTDGTYLLADYNIAGEGNVEGSFFVATPGYAVKYGKATDDESLLSPNKAVQLVDGGAKVGYSLPAGRYDIVFDDGENPTITFVSQGSLTKGEKTDPYLVEEFNEMDPAEAIEDVWLEGYIVGWVKGMFYSSGAQFELDPDGETEITNIIIAGSPSETNPDVCLPVQLPAGEVRDALNLLNNPENLGKRVELKGTFTNYFGRRGFKKVTEYEFLSSEVPSDEAKLTVSINGGASLSYPVANNEETSITVGFEDNYWEVQEIAVNGSKLADAAETVSFKVNGDTKVDVTVGYKGELKFIESSGVNVVELNGSLKVGIEDGNIVVEGLTGEDVVVYNMAGMIVGNYKANETRLSISIDKGVYVVRVGDKAVKVAL